MKESEHPGATVADGWAWRIGESIERWLERQLDRHGQRYLYFVLSWGWIEVFLFASPLGVFIGCYFFLPTVHGYFTAMAATWFALLLAFAYGEFRTRHDQAKLRTWLSTPDDQVTTEIAAGAFAAAARLPRERSMHIAWAAAITIPIGSLPTIAIPGGVTDPFGLTLLFCCAVFVISYGAFVNYVGTDLGMYPIRAQASRMLQTPPPIRVLPIGLRMLIFLGGLTVFAGWFAATFVSEPGSSTWGLTRAFMAAFGVALVLGVVPIIAISHSFLAPVRELIRGTQAVARGDLSFRVPISATDELGLLEAGFNQMIAGLRERDQLRGFNEDLVGELEQSAARMVAAADASRRGIERDLKNGANRYLALMEHRLDLLSTEVAADPQASGLAEEIRSDMFSALAELRDLAQGLYPALLESDGLRAALVAVAERSHLPVHFRAETLDRLSPAVEAAVYFCCLEALQNAGKHAGEGASVQVDLERVADMLTFRVTDDGVGYDTAALGTSVGLQNMADRIGVLGGRMKIDSHAGSGTVVSGSVPVEP